MLKCSQHFPHYNPVGYPLPWTPEFQSNLAQNLLQPFPHPNDGSDKISLLSAHWLPRYSSLKMFTDRHTDRRRLDWYTTRGQFQKKCRGGGRTGLMVSASDSGSGDPGSILGRVGVFVSLSKRHLLPKSTGNTQE